MHIALKGATGWHRACPYTGATKAYSREGGLHSVGAGHQTYSRNDVNKSFFIFVFSFRL
jgi:hypothetical protein